MKVGLQELFFVVTLFAVVASSMPQTAEDWFEDMDANHDGQLNRPEFLAGFERLGNRGHDWWTSTISMFSAANKEKPIGGKKALHEKVWKSFTSGVAVILATEIGDKTFFIAAVLSMKHDRSAVFGGAITALIVMTVLSTAMGLLLPRLLPRKYTHILGSILFLYFGIKLLAEAHRMQAGKASEELEEVEEELLLQSNKKTEEAEEQNDNDEEKQQGKRSLAKSPSSASSISSRGRHAGKTTWYRIAVQSLTLTFLAEWGDRSQIATIALAASHNALGVTLGCSLGHFFCTGLAVLGGRMLAARISEKTVALSGGMLFLLFGLHSIFLED